MASFDLSGAMGPGGYVSTFSILCNALFYTLYCNFSIGFDLNQEAIDFADENHLFDLNMETWDQKGT
jgi:hypothetical protein